MSSRAWREVWRWLVAASGQWAGAEIRRPPHSIMSLSGAALTLTGNDKRRQFSKGGKERRGGKGRVGVL